MGGVAPDMSPTIIEAKVEAFSPAILSVVLSFANS